LQDKICEESLGTTFKQEELAYLGPRKQDQGLNCS